MLARGFRRDASHDAPSERTRHSRRPPDHLRALQWTGVGLAVVLVATVAAARPTRVPPRVRTGMHTLAEAAFARTRADITLPAQPITGCQHEPPLELRAVETPAPVELARLIREAPARLGTASVGSPTAGALWGGVPLVASDGIDHAGDHMWGTDVTVRSIERAVREVRSCFVDTPKLSVGDISRERGGFLRPHRSHQSGLDADVGYYYVSGPGWFQPATAANLDRPRTWALVRALIDGGSVETMFMDHAVQQLLRQYATTIDEDCARLDDIFESDKRRRDVLIHHARGHTTHFHVRFRDAASQALGQRLAPMLRIRPAVSHEAASAELP